jgi:hypothetical protein
MPMSAEKKSIGVTVLWDTETHEARLLDESGVEKARLMAGGQEEGKRLMQKEVDPFAVDGNGVSKEMPPGVTVENLGTDLTVEALNVMGLASPQSAILSAMVFNALIIPALVPLALKGVQFRPLSAEQLLRRNLLVFGIGGVVAPFVGIKLIDLAIGALRLV